MSLPYLRIVNAAIENAPKLAAEGVANSDDGMTLDTGSEPIGDLSRQGHGFALSLEPNNPAQILRALSAFGDKVSNLTPSMLTIMASSFENSADILKMQLIEGLRPETIPETSQEAIQEPAPALNAEILECPEPSECAHDLMEPPSEMNHKDGLGDQTHPLWPKAARLAVNALRKENDALRAQIDELNLRFLKAQEDADTDVLTPTLNRRAFIHEVQRALADCRRYNEEAAIIFLDLDGFKNINDNYGHDAGDKALIYVSQVLKESVREGDSVGRLGGDEFAVLLRRADMNSARLKAMKLEAELIHGSFAYQKLYLKIAGSFGVRAYSGQPTAEIWIAEADAAMFLVKKPTIRL